MKNILIQLPVVVGAAVILKTVNVASINFIEPLPANQCNIIFIKKNGSLTNEIEEMVVDADYEVVTRALGTSLIVVDPNGTGL